MNERIIAGGNGVKWLFMPWQPLDTTDLAVLTAVEESLINSLDANSIVHTCQFVTKVMLQDFPAEVFLQRPAIVTILQALLEKNTSKDSKVFLAVMKMLYKLTRSLRYRIYYYCDPAIMNRRPNVLYAQSEVSWMYESSTESRGTPEEGLPEANYQAYQQQCLGSHESPEIIGANADDSILCAGQMSLPMYCTESLKRVLSLFVEVSGDCLPLKMVKNILELSVEIVDLLIMTLMPSIWLSSDKTALEIGESLKELFKIFAELMEYFATSNADFHRVAYLQIVFIVAKILSRIVPLEIANVVLPSNMKIAITQALMDAPIFVINPGLSATLEQYARHFNDSETEKILDIFDRTRNVTVSLKAAISLMNDEAKGSTIETLKLMWSAKYSLGCHKYLPLLRKYVAFLQEVSVLLEKHDKDVANELNLYLLANSDEQIRKTAYEECRDLISNALGVDARQSGKNTWKKIAFLLEPSILTEIICHGVAGDDKSIKNLAEEILVYILKGKIHIGDERWTKLLEEALIPILGLLQCVATTNSQLGKCVTKMLDPDVYESINLPCIEVVKGNSRLLFSSDSAIREEALCRLIFLLGREKDSLRKLPRLSSLHGLPLSSLCVIERSSPGLKRSEGKYQPYNLLSVLELIKAPDVEPKMRKSALVQISLMLTDTCLHKLFLRENGLPLIIDIMDKSLTERECGNYPDSVIPLLTILKLLAITQASVRHSLSIKPDVYSHILRGLFLFPSNETVKTDASQLLCLLLYHEHIKTCAPGNDSAFSGISLPRIITKRMRLPLKCKSHWQTSENRNEEISFHDEENPLALSFLRQYWYWISRCDSSDDETVEDSQNSRISDTDISETLKITDSELLKLRETSVYYCANVQLMNIQNSTMHQQVTESLDCLWMYVKLWKISRNDQKFEDFTKLPWEQSFVRFLLSQPTNKEDCDLFVDVINFLYFYINTEICGNGRDWLCKVVRKNVTRSLSDLIGSMNTDNQEIREAILKLVRSASAIEDKRLSKCVEDNHEDSWICFVELIVANLCFGDQQQASHPHEKQQHFYNLAYLDWLLRCLTYLTSKCPWHNHKNILVSLGNALIELIISFHGARTVSFMGLSITRNSIICLNHLLHEMHKIFHRNEWFDFWYDEERNMSWLPMLWRNRDPLVRASAFQLLSALTRSEYTAFQLLKTISLGPGDLCQTLIRYFVNRDECCIVREQACIALTNFVKNSSKASFQYMDSLKPSALIAYIEQSNMYYEISVLCSNLYPGMSVESEQRGINFMRSENSETLEDDEGNCGQYVVTPALVSVTCSLLNNLLIIGSESVAKHIYEHSLDKYFLGCFGEIPYCDKSEKKNVAQYCDMLEMYISLCTLLTNCITHCQEFATVASFSSETLYTLLKYLDHGNYLEDEERATYLQKSLTTEVYNFLSILSLTDNGHQHMEAIVAATELSGPQKILISICRSMKDSQPELRMSSIGCLAFLLSLEILKMSDETGNEKKKKCDHTQITLGTILDNYMIFSADTSEDFEFRKVISSLNRLTVTNNSSCSESAKNRKNLGDSEKIHLGGEISKILIHLFIAHNYATAGKKEGGNIARDRDIIIGALSNLLCISREAKKIALQENLGETCLSILREYQTEFNLQPYQMSKSKYGREKRVSPLLNETRRILGLLMNFMYSSVEIKEKIAKAGLADCLDKLWAWISLDDRTITSALELVATFTTNCSEATQSLILTTAINGTGVRRSPNAMSLIHAIINLVGREIDKAGRGFDNQKLHFAFHVLRNAIHVHECRVAISKSNLLQVLAKIHPGLTRRGKPWPLLEVYCLEFLNDFTFYEEGQVAVAKAPDGLDALIELARSNTPTTRLLAISTLRNLVFNPSNRPRLLASAAFMNLLHSTFESGTFSEIGIAGSILWSLVSNNQKGKLTIRSAGFSQSIQEVLGRLSLLNMTDEKQRQDLAKMLHYVVRILSSSEAQTCTEVR